MTERRRKPNQAAQLVDLAHSEYDVVVDVGGQYFAVPKAPPRTAMPLLGRGGALSKRLLLEFYRRTGKTPTPAALTGAVQVLEAEAMDRDRVSVHLRCVRTAKGLVVDLGDAQGRAVVVEGGKWRLAAGPPEGIFFRRTKLTASLPEPSRRGDLDGLRDVLNVTDDGWDLVRAWLVLAWMPHVPVPILSVNGPQGATKTTLGRTLVAIVDPAAAPLRSAPRDLGDWQTTAGASRVVGLDNLSRVPEWLSDALCRAVTGEGAAKRQLYTDDDLIVQTFRRAIVMTSIDPGSLRGDLGERLMPIELRPLRGRRRGEKALNDELRRRLPAILGGVLDLVAEVLANPVRLDRPPRMADAAYIMASVDRATGSSALDAYRRAQASVVETVLESDPLEAALLAFMKSVDGAGWSGTPTELFREVSMYRVHDAKNWPANARTMSERLKRMEPALRSARGVAVKWTRGDRREVRLRWVRRPDGARTHVRLKRHAG
jgi:hypothetical protein